MRPSATSYALAMAGVAGIAWVTSAFFQGLGLASSALLFLLPVLYAATRGVGPGVVAALMGAAAYNFFLLPPRFTFRIHGLENLVSVFVLVAVALVTSHLATRLMAREAEALDRARMSDEAARLSVILAGHPARAAFVEGVEWVALRYGDIRLLTQAALSEGAGAFSSLDLSAAAWALHNGDVTGHGTEVMPAADWTFLPLALKSRADGCVAALARPTDGGTRSRGELEHLKQLCRLLGQGQESAALEAERLERERLEETDRLRRTFLASLAHDFRTPLTVIAGRLKMLAQQNADALDALTAVQRLDRMMTDLIGAARIEAGSLAPGMESVDLIDAVGAAMDGLAVPQNISVRRNIPADLPFVAGDPILLHQIMINLIDNALQRAVSSVALDARLASHAVLFSVSDDGPGVPMAERARIFERFVRLEGSDRTSGSGLGLAIVKGFADAMGMTVSVDDAPMGGTRFTLAIPIAAKRGA